MSGKVSFNIIRKLNSILVTVPYTIKGIAVELGYVRDENGNIHKLTKNETLFAVNEAGIGG